MNAIPMIVTPRLIGSDIIPAVDGRELHGFLGIATPFRDWIVRRIETYGFREGEDFHAELRESPGGRPSREYAISLGMAKELAMVERGEKGRQARAYFLECERRAKAAAVQQLDVLPAAIDARLIKIERALGMQQEKAAAFDLLMAHDHGAVCLTEAAKLLRQKPRAFNIWLSEARWIFRAHDWGTWQAYQRRIDEGLLCHVMVPITRSNGRRELLPQVKVTPAGLRRLAEILAIESVGRGRLASHGPGSRAGW